MARWRVGWLATSLASATRGMSGGPLLWVPPTRADYAFVSIVSADPESAKGMAEHDAEYVREFVSYVHRAQAVVLPVRAAAAAGPVHALRCAELTMEDLTALLNDDKA